MLLLHLKADKELNILFVLRIFFFFFFFFLNLIYCAIGAMPYGTQYIRFSDWQ